MVKLYQCPICKEKCIPMNMFIFNKELYSRFYEYRIPTDPNEEVNKRFKELLIKINAANNKEICQNCLKTIRSDIMIEDFKWGGVEHLDVHGAFIFDSRELKGDDLNGISKRVPKRTKRYAQKSDNDKRKT